MPTARDKRRCALQSLYQFDSITDCDPELVRESLNPAPGSPATHDAGFALALKAWATRDAADAAVAELAPDWPTYRQPIVDRNILRLAYYEMTSGVTPPKVAVNEAIELAREFSTERSPLFINGVLDKILRQVLGRDDASGDASGGPELDPPQPPAPPDTDADTAAESVRMSETMEPAPNPHADDPTALPGERAPGLAPKLAPGDNAYESPSDIDRSEPTDAHATSLPPIREAE